MSTKLRETDLKTYYFFNGNVYKDIKDICNGCWAQYLELSILSQIILIIILLMLCILGIIYIQIIRLPYNINKLIALNNAINNNNTYQALTLLDPSIINIPNDNDYGFTPFLKACWNGNTILVKSMLNMGANTQLTTIRHENAFFLAAFSCIRNITSKDATCIHALFYAGVDINVPNDNGFTAVQMATIYGHTRLVQWLIIKGADIYREPTPLQLAVSHGCTEIVSLFERRTKSRSNGRLRPLM